MRSLQKIFGSVRWTRIFLILVFITCCEKLFAQFPKYDVYQLSGFVFSEDNHKPLNLAGVKVKNSLRGTVTNEKGYFSLPLYKIDTIVFSFIGYKTKSFTLSRAVSGVKYDTLQFYSVQILLRADTIIVPAAYVFPRDFTAFKMDFLNLKLPEDSLQIAGLRPEILALMMKDLPPDGQEVYGRVAQQWIYNQRNMATLKMNPLTDPFAWVKFIRFLVDESKKKKKKK